jgi:hypothetical protein
MLNTRLIQILAPAGPRIHPGRWIEAGTPVGVSPECGDEVRAPLTGVITQVYRCGDRLEIVLEHRREYEEMDD